MQPGIVILQRLGRHWVSSELIPTKLPLVRRVRAGVAMMADASLVEPELQPEIVGHHYWPPKWMVKC